MKRLTWTGIGLFALIAALTAAPPAAWSQDDPADDDEVEAIIAHRGDMDGMMMGRRGPQGFRHRGMGGMFGLGAVEGLDLTAAQREKLDAIRDRQQRQGIEARAQLETAGLDLRKLMRADSPSQTQINTQIDRMAKMRADLQKSRIGAMLEARAVLTDEQRAKLKEARSKRRGPPPHDSQ
jgi:protein CpxP